jgi:ATP-dependent RNA helicase DDX5/DBP2
MDAMLVFCNKIKTVLFVYEFLARQRVSVCAIHGKMTQADREKALADFKAGKYECLVATDVAGRGLHISTLVHVVNYDFPTSLPQYAHRIGRCGRGKNTKGSSLSFFTRNLAVMAPDLVKLLQASKQMVDPNLSALAQEVSSRGASKSGEQPDREEELPNEASLEEDGRDVDTAQAPGDEGDVIDQDDDDDFDDDDSVNELLDFVGAVPLMPFVLGHKRPASSEPRKANKNQLKRPRGKRGGKKNRKHT